MVLVKKVFNLFVYFQFICSSHCFPEPHMNKIHPVFFLISIRDLGCYRSPRKNVLSTPTGGGGIKVFCCHKGLCVTTTNELWRSTWSMWKATASSHSIMPVTPSSKSLACKSDVQQFSRYFFFFFFFLGGGGGGGMFYWKSKQNHSVYTGWPRKNAMTLIVNFKDIINKTELNFILLCGKFIFQQNDTIIKFG